MAHDAHHILGVNLLIQTFTSKSTHTKNAAQEDQLG